MGTFVTELIWWLTRQVKAFSLLRGAFVATLFTKRFYCQFPEHLVLRLEESTGKYKNNPVRVKSFGDRVKFLGMNSSIGGQFPGLKGNCIYFTDDYFSQIIFDSLPIGRADNGVFNMEDRTISPLFPG